MAFVRKKATILLCFSFLITPATVVTMDSGKLLSQLQEVAAMTKSIQEVLGSDSVKSLQKTVESISKRADAASKNIEVATMNFRETAGSIQGTANGLYVTANSLNEMAKSLQGPTDSLKEIVKNLQKPTENLKGMSESLKEIAEIYTPNKIAKASILGVASIYAAYKGFKIICSGCSRGYDCFCDERGKNSPFFMSAWRGIKSGTLPVLGGSVLLAGSGVTVYYLLDDNK